MLPDRHRNGEVVVGEIWAKVLVGQDHIDANNGVLRVLGALEEHVHVDVLDGLELPLCGLDLVVSRVLSLLLVLLLSCTLGISLLALRILWRWSLGRRLLW